jgi:hypothetical protein
MSMPREDLESEVLRLPTAERKRLLDRVVASLDADAKRDAAWDAVAMSREAEIDKDTTVLLSLDDALQRLRNEIQ